MRNQKKNLGLSMLFSINLHEKTDKQEYSLQQTFFKMQKYWYQYSKKRNKFAEQN